MQTTVNKKTIPKYLQLSARLKKDIREGIYQRGGQLPTARELTTLLGVSYLTVSNVLQALEKEGYVKRIHGKGTFVTEPAAAKVRDSLSPATCERKRSTRAPAGIFVLAAATNPAAP